MTALLQIHDEIYKSQDKGYITALLTTDLTAAFDTVDSVILCKKLEHYGVRGRELELIKSYLTDRKQYVEIETFKSKVLNSPPCSVVQGGKMSGLLYTIYTNEVPCLYNTFIFKYV